MADTRDLLILKILKDNPGASLEDIKGVIQVRSTTTAYNLVRKLEKEGLIEPPPKERQARSRRVSPEGEALLRANRML